jgi:hypothetical protein
MAFFNKKQDVINIELTPYGRSLLSEGKLLPAYYAFFDDDILYDSDAGGFTETQKSIKTRILQETPYLRPPRDLSSPEGLIANNERSEETPRPHTKLKLDYLTEPLGTSDQTSDYGPSWVSTFIQGEITGSVSTILTGSIRNGTLVVIPPGTGAATTKIGADQYLKQIPQINANIEYTMRVNNTSNSVATRGLQKPPPDPASKIYPDGTYLELIEEQILCNLREDQGFLLKEGLEMEVYLYDDVEEDKLIPLKFLPKTSLIKNEILLEEPEMISTDFDSSYVEYYINFLTDTEIPTSDICEGAMKLKSKDIEIGIEIDCRDEENVFFDIYNTPIDIEDCD